MNKFGNVELKVDTFRHKLAIEETRTGGLIVHNDRNGEGFSISGESIKSIKAKSGIEGLKQLVLICGLQVPSLKSGLPESVYTTIEYIHSELKRVFEIKNHTDICLLSESLHDAH